MVGPNMLDELDCGSFFDHIDDILDFPCEDIEAGLDLPSGKCDAFPSIWSTHPDSLPGADSVFDKNTNSDLSAELSVPYEDMMQLEWLSQFVDDSFNSESLTMTNENFSTKESAQFHTSSPVSVLESSSSCSGEKPAPCSPESIFPRSHGKARSKRPRPATFQPRPTMQILSPTSSVAETPNNPFVSSKASSDSENYAESRPMVIRLPKQANEENKKKKKIKLTLSSGSGSRSGSVGTDASPNPTPQSVRKCLHCEITKTPQWRAGPLGPKTLCNACGVRYKSGRLFPEYRPAASPTFVPSLHSNSHKKVVEMRNKLGETAATPSQAATTSVLIPNTAPIRMDYI